ncbi:MAG: MBL fold metallo-hydrolase [Candidatus Gracilibacteria bacterium]|nr:MBL fold metallo-hydrolase [Candidatus Gracilibacteria bacterium]
MIITPLGHTEFLVDIANDAGRNIRIMVDGWLSDFSVGDLMERSVKVELDMENIKTVDIIYVSHSHTDHLDPYTLLPIYRNANPILLLPYTLAFVVPLIREYIPEIHIEILYPHQAFRYEGIGITGHMFPQNTITNEDDVMMLSIENDRELLFAEIDTLPEEDDLDTQKQLFRILSKKPYETVCYLASRNELPGQLPVLDLPIKKRKAFRDEYIAGRKEEMYFSYQKGEYEDFANFPNMYEIPNLVRGFIGQGIVYPRRFSLDYARVQIFPLEEIASMESDIARECGYEFPQKALLPGRQYRVENANIETGRKECPIGELIIDREHGNLESTDPRLYAEAPLFPRENLDIDGAKKRIFEVLNTRFLPYWSASAVASLRSALIKNHDGCYRIGLKVSVIPGLTRNLESITDSGFLPTQEGQEQWIIFEYSLADVAFREVPYSSELQVDEDYWLLDIVDFLDGRQELYSNFWHRLDPKKIYRLWMCLGANFCNHDLLLNKYRLHFERAKSGLTVKSFVDEVYNNLSR